MQSAIDRYREMSVELFPTEEIKKLSDDVAARGTGEDVPSRASGLFLPLDLKIVCTMLDEGYSLKETTEALNEHSMFAKATKEISTPEDIRHHADNVMGHVNEVRVKQVGEKLELATKMYLSRSNGRKLDEAQEGGIVLSMLAGGFTPDVVEEVVLKNSVALKGNPELSRTLIDECLQIRRFYNTLEKNISPASVHRGSLSAYKYFASEHLKKSRQSTLTVQSDRAIARQMFSQGMNEDFIMKALRHSPVASEPWRDKKKYIDAVLTKVKDLAKQQKYADDRYMLTASMYEDKINRLLKAVEKKARSYGILSGRAYCDGIVARELLEEHQLRTNVERVIAKKSPEAKKETQKEGGSAYSYAKLIVSAAYAVLRAENDLLQFSKSALILPEVSTYADLKAQGINVIDLYRDAIRRRIMNYPSTAAMLTAPFVDKDVVENLITRYPDIERKDLEKAIREISPRAQMSGIGKDYPATVIESVNERMELLAQQKERRDEYREQMEKRTQSEKAAFTAGSPTWNLSLCAGLAAIRMLQEGHSAMDILPALIQPPDINEPDAIRIMNSAENVLSRIDYIKNYSPLSDLAKEQLESKAKAADEYIRLYQSAQIDRDRLMSDLDVEIAKNMMLKGYSRDDIKEAVEGNSPVSAEPGRNPDYSAYVAEQAELLIEKEKERIKLYKPMPRNEHEQDADKEYEYHMRQMRSSFFLPYEPFMDTLIAEAMLVQGFKAAAIGAAIQKLSPAVHTGENYGMDIMKNLEANAKGFVNEGPVRVRAIEGT